jgi:hypothetical protein
MTATPRRTIRVDDATWADWQERSGGNVSAWLRALVAERIARVKLERACPHRHKRAGDSGLLVCVDCGKVNP